MRTDDVLVNCAKCAADVGYVAADGHRDWLCAECAGDLNPKAIGADEAARFAVRSLSDSSAQTGQSLTEVGIFLCLVLVGVGVLIYLTTR